MSIVEKVSNTIIIAGVICLSLGMYKCTNDTQEKFNRLLECEKSHPPSAVRQLNKQTIHHEQWLGSIMTAHADILPKQLPEFDETQYLE